VFCEESRVLVLFVRFLIDEIDFEENDDQMGESVPCDKYRRSEDLMFYDNNIIYVRFSPTMM
jgi:hypothetical protein